MRLVQSNPNFSLTEGGYLRKTREPTSYVELFASYPNNVFDFQNFWKMITEHFLATQHIVLDETVLSILIGDSTTTTIGNDVSFLNIAYSWPQSNFIVNP